MSFAGAKMSPVSAEVQVMFTQRVALTCVLASVLTLAACSTTPRVSHDADTRANIGNYHTYLWEQSAENVPSDGPAFNNPLNQKRLRAAVEANLAKQGLQPAAEGAKPDAYVTVSIGSRQTIETSNRFPVRVGVGFGYGRGYWNPYLMNSVMWDANDIYSYREGRVSVDLFDASKREGIWHASVEQDLTYLTGDKAEARINAVVDAMFTKFPGAAAAK
jgi:Domain of unknown function (DUF4136)